MDKLVIDRQRVKDSFLEYTSGYDLNDEKIKLKTSHTYRVAALCDRIAQGLGLSPCDTDMAWLIGMLHDVGRFEQVRKYGTFSDAKSIDHAHYAASILFDEGKINDYLDIPPGGVCDKSLDIIKKAVWNHSAYRIEEGLEERTVLFCNIIRDADKLDIFRVINDTPLEDIYNVNSYEVYNSQVSDGVMSALMERHAVLRSLKKTPADHIAGHIALVFELVFPVSLDIAKEQGYLEKLIDFKSHNKKTREQFKEIKELVSRYME